MNHKPPTSDTLLVIIPAWNEGEVIGPVLDELAYVAPEVHVVVVSDGSTDDTVEIARERGATVLELQLNLGVGGAMRAGYLYAKRHGYEWAAQLDADGQHDPAELTEMLEIAKSSGADLVIGSRFLGKGDYRVRGPRKWGMGLTSLALKPVTRTRITDPTSGFKLSSRHAIELFSARYPAEYLGDTIGALTLAAKERLKIVEIPVRMRQRSGGDPSHGPLKSARFLLKAWFALAIALTRSPSPKGD